MPSIKHVFLIGFEPEFLEKFQTLEYRYQLSWDSCGMQFLKDSNEFIAPQADLLVVPHDYFQKYMKNSQGRLPDGSFPEVLVTATPDEAAALEGEEFSQIRYNVATLPLNMAVVNESIAKMLANGGQSTDVDFNTTTDHYKQLFLKAPVAHFLVDPFSMQIVEANKAGAQLFFKTQPKDVEGTKICALLQGSKCELQKRFNESIESGECTFTESYSVSGEIQNKDFAFYLSQIHIEGRMLIFMSITDITQVKNAERNLTLKNLELHKIKAELDYFIYSISHELRAPLVSVLGLLGLIETEKTKREQNRYLALMKESINKLDKIIHDFIDYARNERQQVELEPIDFGEIMEKVKSDLNYLPYFDQVQISLNLNQSVPFSSDPRRVTIILRNLLCNCIKFRNPESKSPWAKVTIEVSPSCAKIRVDDNGVGISNLKLPKIFNMFYTGHQDSNGSGIGLYIVKEIVHKLDGTCEVVSKPGIGARFLVTLPNKIAKQ